MHPVASNASEAEITVREISERWHHRPAARKLLCRPFVQSPALKPWQPGLLDAWLRGLMQKVRTAGRRHNSQ